MPKKIQECSRAHLISVPLPQHGVSYTVISHQFVIDYSFQALAQAGFGVVNEEYRCTADGQIAQGIYTLQYNNDPELSMMFAWTNSYNKQVKFKCLIGAYIETTGTVMTSGEIGTWTRKHMGSADVETKATIDDQITNAHMYYNQLVNDKNQMLDITLNKRKQSQLLGILFAEYQVLTTEQANIIRAQMDRPSHVYKDSNSLWAFYNYVTIALQQSHPKTWMEDQRILHMFISEVNKLKPLSVPVPIVSIPVDPLTTNYGEPENQTNLLVQIAEITGDESVLEPSLPVEPANYDFTQTVDYSNAVYPKTEDEAFQNIKEVTEEALKDEAIFGISGIAVSAEGIRNVPVEEVLEKMQESDNQVVQEEVEIEAVLHQSGEMIEEAIEDDTDEVPWHNDEVVTYTDPAGNTFEALVVPPCAAHDSETEKELEEEIRETEVKNFFEEVEPQIEPSLQENNQSLAMSPADYEMMEAIEFSEGTPAIANLDDIPVEKNDFDLDVSFDDDSNVSDSTPDFF